MRHAFNRGLTNTLPASALLVLLAGTAAGSPTIDVVQPLTGDARAFASGMSGDGSTVVGWSVSGTNAERGLVWTQAGGSQIAQSATGQRPLRVLSVSNDASIYLGKVTATSYGVLWTASTSFKPVVNDVIGFGYSLGALSGDGAKVVGAWYLNGPGVVETRPLPATWDSSGAISYLEWVPTLGFSTAVAASTDGSVIAGWGYNRLSGGQTGTFSPPMAVVWRNGSPQSIFHSAPGVTTSEAKAVSGDGAYVVGFVTDTVTDAYRANAAGAVERLGRLPGAGRSFATAVNDDGSIVFGHSEIPSSGERAWMWTPAHGTRELSDVLLRSGVSISGWTFQRVIDASLDGSTIVGTGLLSGQSKVFVISGLGTGTTCSASDIAGPNQAAGSDGSLTADDIIVYVNWFCADDMRADVAGPNQAMLLDNALTADDLIVFLARYFAGC